MLVEVPAVLEPQLRDRLAEWRSVAHDLAHELERDARIGASLSRVFACSEFVARSACRCPGLVSELLDDDRLAGPHRGVRSDLGIGLDAAEASFAVALRRIRTREMLRIAWRDLAGFADLAETLDDLTTLADELIAQAVEYAERAIAARFGTPANDLSLLVLAMGKLGGGELNFSSDVDLIFLFGEEGTTAGDRSTTHSEFFKRAAQIVIRLLDQRSADGFVFRADTRLRPFGASGALALSLDALESYLQSHGRVWERYAYVKARPLTGGSAQRERLAAFLTPFVYRRYLDYGVFESLRKMKQAIMTEVMRRDMADDIKRGPGGIREVEFIVQSLQLVRGGRVRSLQTPSISLALRALVDRGYIKPAIACTLFWSYSFLRRLENRLQAWRDEQTHRIPDDETERARLACAMGYRDWGTLERALAACRAGVQSLFEELVVSGRAGSDATERRGEILWQARDVAQAEEALADTRTADRERLYKTMASMRDGGLYRRLDQSGKERLDRLMPTILQSVADFEHGAEVFARVAGIIERVGRRSAYFALLNENPGALARLLELCAKSPRIARQVEVNPLVLDLLIDPRHFESPPSRERLAADLDQAFSNVSHDDAEAGLEALRQFQQVAVFEVALADLSGVLPLMRVSDRLTDIAELVLQKVLEIAQRDVRLQRGGDPGLPFAIIAYGKLGGLELGYGSDLDLVFIYGDSDGEDDGAALFFARLVRRIVHILTTPTLFGELYAVDTRLRPSGHSGMLVTSLSAFERYQLERAWTWEHQALLRARAAAGDNDLCAAFELVRRRVLAQERDADQLREKVSTMRAKMRASKPGGAGTSFHPKHGRGGLADIEFIVQFLVLRHAPRYPDLTRFSDHMRQLDALCAHGLLEAATTEQLQRAYLAYREHLHHCYLGDLDPCVDEASMSALCVPVAALWDKLIERNSA